MLLGDYFLLVLGLFVIGLIGFLVMSLALLARLMRWAFHRLTGPAADAPPGQRWSRCVDRRCAHQNRPEARFCSRCGRPLAHVDRLGDPDLDAYG